MHTKAKPQKTRMKPVKAWAVTVNGRVVTCYVSHSRAELMSAKLRCERIVRVEIRELPKRKGRA